MAEMIPRVYANFRGVDFRGEEINLVRSPDSVNMWKDYKEIDSIRTRPGLEMVMDGSTIHGIYPYKGAFIVHEKTKLLKTTFDGTSEKLADVADRPSQGFVFEDVFYLVDGNQYLQYDGTECKAVEGYVPTTTIGRKPMGGGTKYEDVNMISPYRKNSFVADGGSFDFFLDVMNIDEDYVPTVTYNDNLVDPAEYDVDYKEGKITFKETAPDVPLTEGQDNIVVQFKKAVPQYSESVEKCTLVQVFDNRVFFSGNPDRPNVVLHSSLNDPTYVSDLDYYFEGMDDAAVKGLVAGNNALWVFREPSTANATVFYHTPTIDNEYGKVYPSIHSSITTGCVGKAINFNDDIVFFSERGMEGISGDVTTEQVVAHRSSLVDRKMITERDYKNMVLAEWEGYLLVFIGNKVYLADSRATFTNENHMEYEWFYWELEDKVTSACVHNGVLYVGTEYGVYTMTDLESNVESYWTTPKDRFKNPHKLKTTNKRGCVAEAKGDITVWAKKEDDEFEHIGTYENVQDYFVCRIKRKKFKDLQLKFHSITRFSLETATLQVFVGGYVKR